MSLTRNVNSIISENAKYSFGYKGQAVTIGKLTSLYILFGYILSRMGYPVGKMMLEITEKLPQLLPSMIPQAKESSRPLGINLKDEDQIFVVGGGINWGLTYQFAICTLQEMCWVHATPIDFSEWRHGPIEIFSPGKTAIFLKGRGSQTVNEENIIGWCKENGVNCLVFNSQELDVDNLVTPFTLFVELEWLGYYLSLAKNRDMEIWRYYDDVAF
jgi:fructoselysine-6-P-deglycase FrlB-like protein